MEAMAEKNIRFTIPEMISCLPKLELTAENTSR
jgi:hypothetical protein